MKIFIPLVVELGERWWMPSTPRPRPYRVDLSLGERAPLLPVAEPLSVARLHLERVLPTALDDARHMVLVTRRLDAARDREASKRA